MKIALLYAVSGAVYAIDFHEPVNVSYHDLTAVKYYLGNAPVGGGAIILVGKDPYTGEHKGGAYFVYDGSPGIAQDRGAIALYPYEANRPASLSIAPSGDPQYIVGEDTASLGLQYRNGINNESRFVAVMKKTGEMRFATISTGATSEIVPMVHYVNNWKLLELTKDGQVNIMYRGYPVMDMMLPYGVVKWSTAQVPVLFQSSAEVLSSGVLASAPAGAEVSFTDADGIIKKAIKQHSGAWLRANNLQQLY